MAEPFEIKIDSILGGISPTLSQGSKNQFHASIGIDPDLPKDDTTAIKTSGILRPSGYADFTGANVNSQIVGMTATPKNNLIYTALANGKLISYTAAGGSETLVDTVAGTNAGGIFYYNNYVYITGTGASKDDISRYGPLDNSPSLTDNVWKGATLGSQTALTNTVYPALYPNHWGHVHIDNKVYFCDYVNGQGLIHFIKTSKNTDEGDTDDGTTYNALDLPFGYYPTDIASWGDDIVVSAMGTINTGSAGGRGALFFWDTVSDSFYRVIYLPDPICSAVLNKNGILYIWSGNVNNGVRVSRYIGGQSLEQIAFFEEGISPSPAAVDGLGNRIVWGANTSYPEKSASVYALGYKDANLPFALHNIINTDSAGDNPRTTAILFAEQASFVLPRLKVAWHDDSDNGIDDIGTSYNVAVFRSLEYQIGSPFRITEINIPLASSVGVNMTVTPKFYFDKENSSQALTAINNTNYSGSEIVIKNTDESELRGTNSFFLELRWSGSALLPVSLPIVIKGEIEEHGTE